MPRDSRILQSVSLPTALSLAARVYISSGHFGFPSCTGPPQSTHTVWLVLLYDLLQYRPPVKLTRSSNMLSGFSNLFHPDYQAFVPYSHRNLDLQATGAMFVSSGCDVSTASFCEGLFWLSKKTPSGSGWRRAASWANSSASPFCIRGT